MLAHRSDEFPTFFSCHDALMLKQTSSLSKADREMIFAIISVENDCLYFVAAYGALLRIYAKNLLKADQVAVNHHKAAIILTQKVMPD
jgi:uncharacterized peroxidase-related enzyme